jgi:hypothetical protein
LNDHGLVAHATWVGKMNKVFRNDWVHYWARFDDLMLLQKKSTNIDETLLEIEGELDIKLLSGDQMQVLDALENRIKEMSKHRKPASSMQTSLFD